MRTPMTGWGATLGAVLVATACNREAEEPAPASGPFKSVEVAANESSTFIQPLAGVPLASGGTAFIATQSNATETGVLAPGIFVSDDAGVRLLHAGPPLSTPLDIDVDLSGDNVLVADRTAGADGLGAIFALSLAEGSISELGASGYGPVSVTVAKDGRAYFSGRNPETGLPGVYLLDAGSVSAVYEGAPLVDPSGIALFDDGRVLVADTRLSDENLEISSEAGVVLIAGGQASIFVTGFETGYPAGIALTTNEKTLIVSGQGADQRDKVFLFDVATLQGSVIEAEFSVEEMSSGGLKRARTEDTFVWSSLSFGGGTVYTIKG